MPRADRHTELELNFVDAGSLTRAQRDLVTTDAKVPRVALDAGFGSLGRFDAAFRAACGC
jgi:transcriptional regulator GlxA family with amidase domain